MRKEWNERMKTCVSTYSFGRYNGELGICGVIDRAAEMGFDGIEFAEGEWMNVPPKELEAIGAHAASRGLARVSLCVAADFARGDEDEAEREIQRVCTLVDRAAALGVSMMRHDAASQPRDRKYGIGYDDCLPRVAAAVRRVTAYAAAKGVRTMTENHGYFSQDANRVEKLINAVAHPNFGALVDLGNFMCADEEPTISVGIMAPYAKHVHAKDFFWKSGMDVDPGEGWFRTRAMNYLRGAIIGQGVAKVYQSIQILKKSGYDGYITVEFEGMEDNLKGIRVGKDNLTRFING